MSGMVSETSLKEQATARAAEERHMEILNLASNKLDCELFPGEITTLIG